MGSYGRSLKKQETDHETVNSLYFKLPLPLNIKEGIRMVKVKIGDQAPDFTLKANTGENHFISVFWKEEYCLFFYPRDEGPTCVKEAQAFRNDSDAFKERNAEVIGIKCPKCRRT